LIEEDKISCILKGIREVLVSEIPRFPKDCCFEASLLVGKVFSELKYDVKIHDGYYKCENHYWNEINGMLFDITIDQFEVEEDWSKPQNGNRYHGREITLENEINRWKRGCYKWIQLLDTKKLITELCIKVMSSL